MTPAEQLAAELGAPERDVDAARLVPMLSERDASSGRVLSDDAYLFELKLDGVRILADRRGDRVSLTYRKSRDATVSYPEIADAVRAIPEERVVLDGEIVAFDDQGRPDFERLGTRIQSFGKDARRAAAKVPVAYVVFDVLAVGDRDLRGLSLDARKKILDAIALPAPLVRNNPSFDDGESLFRLCRDKALEGVVAKRRDAPYKAGERTSDWIKIKCESDVDLVVIGWTEGEGRRASLGALDLGAYDAHGELVVCGSAGSGLDGDTIDALLRFLREIEVPKPVAKGKYLPKRGRHHVKPAIVVSVRYTGVTSDGLLRHPVFRGVRPDMSPTDCSVPARG